VGFRLGLGMGMVAVTAGEGPGQRGLSTVLQARYSEASHHELGSGSSWRQICLLAQQGRSYEVFVVN
jgi:hypothetical protein